MRSGVNRWFSFTGPLPVTGEVAISLKELWRKCGNRPNETQRDG